MNWVKRHRLLRSPLLPPQVKLLAGEQSSKFAHSPATDAGKYEAPKTGALTVARRDNLLILRIGSDKKFLLHPESETMFFTADRDLTFEFVKAGTKVSKIIVREHGAVVEEAMLE